VITTSKCFLYKLLNKLKIKAVFSLLEHFFLNPAELDKGFSEL